MIQQRGLVPRQPEYLVVGATVAFRDVYDAHAADCYRVARLVVRDAQLAQDVVQNVFEAFWTGSARFDETRGSVRSWLLMVTHHKAVDAVRRNQRHSGPELTETDLGRLQAFDDVEDEGLRGLRTAHVSKALATLSDAQRQVIILAYFGGCSQSEIALATGTALGTVKTRTLHALRQLRANLDLVALATDEGWRHEPVAIDAA